MRARLLPLLLLALTAGVAPSGCKHRVLVESDPPGASVRLDRSRKGITPVEFKVGWVPIFFKRYNVRVKLPGYRTVQTTIRDDMHAWSPTWRAIRYPGEALDRVPLHTYQFLLIPDHGPTGTWRPDEVP
jgi:hypothetical protein